MLFLDHESDSCRSGIVLKLQLSVTFFWRFFDQTRLQAQIPRDWINELFSQGTEDCQSLRYENLIIVDSKYIEMSSLAVLRRKDD